MLLSHTPRSLIWAMLLAAAGCVDSTAPQRGPTATSPRPPAPATPRPVIYISDGSGADPRPLTTGSNPVWSPDGRKIAFVRSGPDEAALFLIDQDGSGLRRLGPVSRGGLTPRFDLSAPEWSPTGNHIAYVFYSNGRSELRVIDIPTGGETSVVSTPPNGLGWESGIEIAGWSPDGARIAVLTILGGYLQLSVVDRRGSAGKILTNATVNDAHWSPDGRSFALADREGLMTIDADDQTLQMVDPQANPSQVRWSAAGDKILVATSFREGVRSTLYLANRDGAERVELHSSETSGYYFPRWLPDGRTVAWTTNQGVWTLPTTGGAPVLLLAGVRDAVWSPSGDRIAYVKQEQDVR